MQVILLERIEKLGQMGDVVNVKAGYARNFLLPKKKAMRATNSNQAVFEQQRTQLEADNLKRRQEAESVSVKIDGISVTIIRQAGDSGQLYGSVSARDISESVTEAGATVNRNQILLNKPIKALGVYETRVALHPEVSVNITVNIARTEEEAKLQLEAGSALINTDQLEENEGDTATEVALAIADDAEAEVAAAEGLVEEEVSDNLASELLKEKTSDETDNTSEDV
ncbi:MAG: 50S ribosomal protein L9 [Rhodospirillaceae bacterium]|nr:50S ribosomal protein L9 [Rhodospirillaceae bacterium]|tara:strand:+ start:443 stop:1120 length:678 start_codon:yes stop_codon:yes gene_type:complete